MRTIIKNNKIIYNYNKHKISDGVKNAIILYCIAVLLLFLSIFISFICLGNAPSFVAGIGISSILFNVASIIHIILEIYLDQNFHNEIRVMLLLELLLFTIWIFII